MFHTIFDLVRYDSKFVAIFELAQSGEFAERLFSQGDVKQWALATRSTRAWKNPSAGWLRVILSFMW